MKATENPYGGWCSICGLHFAYLEKHQCDSELLERIERGRLGHCRLGRSQSRSYPQRLKEGFDLLEE